MTEGLNERALLEAVDDVAEMAGRVKRNGAERHYAGEKLNLALFKVAEALALLDEPAELVMDQVREGYRRGMWLAGRLDEDNCLLCGPPNPMPPDGCDGWATVTRSPDGRFVGVLCPDHVREVQRRQEGMPTGVARRYDVVTEGPRS